MGIVVAQMLLGWIPDIGNIINVCTAATVTEKLGWLIVKDFAREAADRIAYQHQ